MNFWDTEYYDNIVDIHSCDIVFTISMFIKYCNSHATSRESYTVAVITQ